MIDNDDLAERLTRVLRDARVSPRVLSAATKVHYTSIYALKKDRNGSPLTVDVLNKALDKIEALMAAGRLPLEGKIPQVEKAERLKILLDN